MPVSSPMAIEGFLDRLDLRDVTLAGVSIGGSIALILAARHNPRVTRVIAINPYDYAKGRGMARSSLFGWIVTYASLIPVIGETVMRLRNFLIMQAVLHGGVAEAKSIPPALHEGNVYGGQSPGPIAPFSILLRISQQAGRPPPRITAASRSRPLVWRSRTVRRRRARTGSQALQASNGHCGEGRTFPAAPSATRRSGRSSSLRDAGPLPYCSSEAVSAVAGGCGLEIMKAATSQACCTVSTGSR